MISIPTFLTTGFDNIETSFTQLQSPISFLQIEPLKFHKRKCSRKIQSNNFFNDNSLYRYIILLKILTISIIEKNK